MEYHYVVVSADSSLAAETKFRIFLFTDICDAILFRSRWGKNSESESGTKEELVEKLGLDAEVILNPSIIKKDWNTQVVKVKDLK